MSRKLRVLLVGETVEFGLTRSFAWGFEQAGAETTIFDYYGRLHRPSSGGLAGRLLLRAQIPARRPAIARSLLAAAEELAPDLVFFVKCDDLHSGVYARLRQVLGRARIAAFHPDDPFNVRRLFGGQPSHPRALAQAAAVDAYFLWSRALLARMSGVRGKYLAFGVDPRIHHPVDAGSLRIQASFVGNWDRRREAFLRAFEGSGIELGIWGSNYWATRCSSRFLRSCWRGAFANGPEFARVVAGSTVSINILRTQNLTGHNMRTFEIPACGGAMLTEWSDDQAGHFAPDEEALFYRTPEEMVRRASEAVNRPGELAALRERALRRSREHTYEVRAREVLGVLLDDREAMR